MGKHSDSHATLADTVWLRWALILACVIVWLAVTREFPLYFQRDEVQMMNWVNHHGFLDGFIPTRECGFSHDASYRPLLYSYWWILYKTFGLHFEAFYVLTGLMFILVLAYQFKLVAKLSDNRSGYLSIVVWLAAFQFLMTILFWVTEQGALLIMILTLGGLFSFVTGLGTSKPKVVFGCFLMLASFLIWEPLPLVLGTTIAVFIATRAKSLGWSVKKTACLSAAAFLVGPAYWIGLPFGRQRLESSSASLMPTAADVASRFAYYMGHLFSGITGIVLLVPAVYCIISCVLARTRLRDDLRVPISLAATLVVSVAVVKLQVFALGLALILVAGLLLPKITYMFLPMVCVPIAGLLVFAEPSRTYLFLPSHALAALAGIEMSRLWGDVRDWWAVKVSRPALTVTALVLAVLLTAVPLAFKMRAQVDLLRLRSNVTQNVKMMTPHLKSLPRGATVVMVGYDSMGIDFGKARLHWTDRQKLLYQAPIDNGKAGFWFNDIGRHDLQLLVFSKYIEQPDAYLRRSPVYMWLQTPKDHEFFAKQGLRTTLISRISHGETRSTLLRICPGVSTVVYSIHGLNKPVVFAPREVRRASLPQHECHKSR